MKHAAKHIRFVGRWAAKRTDVVMTAASAAEADEGASS